MKGALSICSQKKNMVLTAEKNIEFGAGDETQDMSLTTCVTRTK